MKKEILVFIAENYADWEVGYICPMLRQAKKGYKISTIALEVKTITSQGGLRVSPDYSLDHLPQAFEMLILVGGTFWAESSFKVPAVKVVTDYCLKNRIPVGAICDAATFLAECGYLNTIKHTGNSREHMQLNAPAYKGGANFIERQSVSSDNIVTANGTASLEFALEIIRLLNALPENEANDWFTMYKNGVFPH